MGLKTGPIPKIENVEEEILSILVDTGGVGFGKLRELLGKVKDERRKTKSPATINKCLKKLADNGLAYGTTHPREWRATSFGAIVAHARNKMLQGPRTIRSGLTVNFSWGHEAMDMLNAIDAKELEDKFGITKEGVRENIKKNIASLF